MLDKQLVMQICRLYEVSEVEIISPSKKTKYMDILVFITKMDNYQIKDYKVELDRKKLVIYI